MGYRKLSADHATMLSAKERLRILKKLPGASGTARARKGGRRRNDRDLVQDEARIGQRTKSHAGGPSAARAKRSARSAHASTYIFGAVCQSRAKVRPFLCACNTEAIDLHLVEIAKTVAPGAHAVLLVDQAGWHMSTYLVVPSNIAVVAMPPKSPELNPVEDIWQFMRDNWLSNRIFRSYENLADTEGSAEKGPR